MTKRWFIRACLAGMLGLFTAAIAFAVPSIVLERRGGSYTIFDIKAYNLENVGAIELLINYDRAAFKNPSISWGDFILPHYHMGNTNFAPGQVKMAIASITGINASSGVLATLTFEPNVNPAAGTVTWGMTPSVISTNAETLGSSGLVPNPPPVTSTTSDTGTTPSTSATTSTSTGTTSGTTTSTSAGTSTAGTSGTGLGTVTISTLDTSAPPVGQTAPEFSESLTTSSGTGAGTSTEGTAAATGNGRTPSAGEGRDVGGAARDSSVERAALKAAQNIKDQEKFASY
ncbi:MAG TPA: cohesin domain-containing protein, partial [Geobacteraceae bacterium]